MPWTCLKCNRKLSRPNAWHQCIQKPLEEMFANREPSFYTLFTQVHQQLVKWKAVQASATQNCVVYVARRTFLVIRPMKSALDIKFYLDVLVDEFPVYKTESRGKRIGHYLRLFETNDIDSAVWILIKRSYMEDIASS